jgi:hypothetical protein
MTTTTAGFDKIYSLDLTYVPDCWKLCGDAHCCNFSRYKSRFKLILKRAYQELMLLPGEYEYLSSKGWLEQFAPFEYRKIEFPIRAGTIKMESIISRKPNCACAHATRPVICRLYPLLPVFDVAGHVTAVESFTIYETLEKIENLPSACKIESLPFTQFNTFLDLTNEIAGNIEHLFYIMAYRIAKNHVTANLVKQKNLTGKDAFIAFEQAFMRRQLIDKPVLQAELDALADQFIAHYGSRFQLS